MESETTRIRRRIGELAKDYKEKGYRVFEEPGPGQLPQELDWFRPDLVAKKKDDFVVIEVKSSAGLREDYKIHQFAKELEAHPNWRFELVLTNTRKPKEVSSSIQDRFADWAACVRRIDSAESLLQRNQIEEALLIGFSGIEGLLWTKLKQVKSHESKHLSVTDMAKALYSMGEVSSNFENLVGAFSRLRNNTAHGGVADIPRGKLRDLFHEARELDQY